MKRFLLLILLQTASLLAAEPMSADRVRQTLRTLTCQKFSAEYASGPALAEALQETFRKESGGGELQVVWQGDPAYAMPKGSAVVHEGFVPAWSLLNQASRSANVFWGLRDGAVVLDTKPLLRTVCYPILPGVLAASTANRDDPGRNLTDFLVNLTTPVHWREGERPVAMYDRTNSRLCVTASEEHFDAVTAFIASLQAKPRQVQVSATWVAYPAGRIEAALAASPTMALSQADLRAMFAQGEKKILSTQTLVTISGNNAVTESVEEIIYPTEFDVNDYDMGVGFSGQPGENARYINQVIIPGAFETREIGSIFNVTPTVSVDSDTIHLQLLPEIAELERWIEYGRDITLPPAPNLTAHMPQPVFRSHNVTGAITLKSGATMAMSGGRNAKTGEYVYLYVNATCVDTEGQPLR